MDNIMEKLAQKLSAQEMIKANTAAESAETERMTMQIKQYQKEIEEMKKNSSDIMTKLDSMDTSGESVHDVGVRVYRNVQAEQQKQTKLLQDNIADSSKQMMDEIKAYQDDNSAKLGTDIVNGTVEHITAVVSESDSKLSERLDAMENKLSELQEQIAEKNDDTSHDRGTSVSVVSALTLIGVVSCVALMVMSILGML